MTRLTTVHKRELAAMMSAPARYRELKPILMAYMPKTSYRTVTSFENALKRDAVMHEVVIPVATGGATSLYSSLPPEQWDPYQVAQALLPSGYFCNLTSVYYHELTNQVPKHIYLGIETSREKDQKRVQSIPMSDHAIFNAFVQAHRVSKHTYQFPVHEITITERVNRGDIGVESVRANHRVCPKGARVTSLERAIIDAVVQPQYNGGIGAVIELLRAGLPRVNQHRFIELYDKLGYVYPYWQSIGFLCERTGFSHMADAIMQGRKLRNKFYLDHLAKTSWEFDSKWQIYFPRGVV